MYFEVLYCAGRNDGIICVAMVVIGDDVIGVLMGLIGGVVAPTPDGELSEEGLHEYRE